MVEMVDTMTGTNKDGNDIHIMNNSDSIDDDDDDGDNPMQKW
jgi:hypothetical protein